MLNSILHQYKSIIRHLFFRKPKIQEGDKLYVVVRSDIPVGLQVAQIAHICFSFASEHSKQAKQWMKNSNFICVLSVPNEQSLVDLMNKAYMQRVKYSFFQEDDLNYQITAIALECCEKSKRLCKKLPLAMK
jgi:peptidyl-tRNA hydrolase